MVTTYYAIATEKVITAGIDALLNSSPQSLIEKGMQALKEDVRYSDIFGAEDLGDSYFEIGTVSATREGPKFQLIVPQEKLLEALTGDYLFVDGYRGWYTRDKFINLLEKIGYRKF